MKIAIKVSTEFEMGFLMGIFKNESLFPKKETSKSFDSEFCIVPYGEFNWSRFAESNTISYRDYEVVSFKAWAQLKGIEVPKCIVINQGTYKIEVYSANCYIKTNSTALYFTPKQIQEILTAFNSINV